MTLQAAKQKAQAESRNGYVQHVNRTVASSDLRGLAANPEYFVSDWYDSETTVASYENGKPLNGTE